MNFLEQRDHFDKSFITSINDSLFNKDPLFEKKLFDLKRKVQKGNFIIQIQYIHHYNHGSWKLYEIKEDTISYCELYTELRLTNDSIEKEISICFKHTASQIDQYFKDSQMMWIYDYTGKSLMWDVNQTDVTIYLYIKNSKIVLCYSMFGNNRKIKYKLKILPILSIFSCFWDSSSEIDWYR
ncbi:MAG: hypothetical protein FVQ77_07860 [Cytophagales bacterium]|nr:hypothetical protein [Cytophagales bacterium]